MKTKEENTITKPKRVRISKEVQEQVWRKIEEIRRKTPLLKRDFARNVGEASEAKRPTIEELYNENRKGDPQTREEVLRDGTLEEKILLYLAHGDIKGFFNSENEILTPEEVAMIGRSIRTPQEEKFVADCFVQTNTMMDFSRRVLLSFKRFQVALGSLAMSLSKWEMYEKTLSQLSLMYETTAMLQRDEANKEDLQERILEQATKSISFDDADIIIKRDQGGAKLAVDIFIEGGLYSKIEEEVEEVTKWFADFKGYMVVAYEYMSTSAIPFKPATIMMCERDAIEEIYAKYLIKDPSFFRSYLNERKRNGEIITPEEERRAVIPDYSEIKPLNETIRDCRGGLKLLENENRK